MARRLLDIEAVLSQTFIEERGVGQVWGYPLCDCKRRQHIRSPIKRKEAGHFKHAFSPLALPTKVERITKLMDAVRAQVGGNTATLTEFVEYVQSSKPQCYPSDGEQILESYRDVLKDAYAKLPEYFHRMPEVCRLHDLP